MTFLLVLLSFFSTTAYSAGPAVTSVSGASAFTTATAGTATVYGGLAGEDCSGVNANGSTCNNCTVAQAVCAKTPLCACNTARPYTSGVVTINLKKPDGVNGEALMVTGTTNTVVAKKTGTNGGTFIDFEWQTLASQLDSAPTLDAITGVSTFTGKIFIDKDGNGGFTTGEETTDVTFKFIKASDDFSVYGAVNTDGIGGSQGFVPYPGDEKVYIEDIESTSNFPTLGYNAKVKFVRVFRSDAGLASANVDSSGSKDIAVDDDGTLSGNQVRDLENNKAYVFRIGLVDEANNLVQFYPDTGADATCDAGTPFTGCPWAATPEEVLGLLTDDVNCFVATAAYGSSLEPKLKTFRDFRYKVLLRHAWGRKFVSAYYKYGPIAARYIHDKPVLRAIARAGLWPLYAFSTSALKFGFLKTSLFAILLLLSLVSISRLTFRSAFGRN